MVANSGVGSMPSSASRSASGTTSVARKPSSSWLNLCPIPSAPGVLFQEGGDVAVQGPHVQLRDPAVSRPGRLDAPVRQGQAGDRHRRPPREARVWRTGPLAAGR